MANRLGSDLLTVFLETPGWAKANAQMHQSFQGRLAFVENLGAGIVLIGALDVANGLASAAQERNIGRIR